VPDGHLCCGSAGTYSLTQPELSRQLRDNKMNALESGYPEVIATANVGCQSHLDGAGRTPVRHWIELVEAALSLSEPRRLPDEQQSHAEPGRSQPDPHCGAY
jgi:glycolate oxidase iron-sulfur subunit